MPGSLFFTNKQKITLEKILVQCNEEIGYMHDDDQFHKERIEFIEKKIQVINKVLRHIKLNDRCN